ncbi:MAG: ABC transporter ATP-binding protein [Acidobacteria bacterium]|nr:ABC transporter ATP-binding protein [Acidobacteriota bacterium]
MPEHVSAPIVELRGVSKSYAGHTALENFSLEVRGGEFLTLLGPSGSGKTTILRLVAGFDQPQAGQIFIEGRDASALPPYQRNVNTVFQHYALFPHLTVFENVSFGLQQKKAPRADLRQRVKSVLEVVDLPGKAERDPNQLSGGEKQRVALARAVVLEPAVLLLDEPLGALDEKLRRQMQVELKRLHERLKITFIFVTHDQEEALVMADRVAVLNRGRLEQVGPAEEIYARPRTRFVADFMGVENFFEAKLAGKENSAFRFETKSSLSLWASNSGGLAEGSAAILAVRPEALRLAGHPTNPAACNQFEGEVVESHYEGGSERWVIQLATGERLVVRRVNVPETQIEGIRRGSKGLVSWDPARTLVFPQ